MNSLFGARSRVSQAALGTENRLPGGRIRPWLALAAVVVLCVTAAGVRAANQDNGPELRTVHGTVIDTSENPVATAVVYLKNMKTQSVKTYIPREDGLYRFSGLDPNVDYQVHAQHNEMISVTRTISSYDSRRDIDLPLKLSHKKAEH